MSNRIGVVVVTYNSAAVIGDCLDNCREMSTVVVDNASRDETLDQVRRRPWVDLLANPENRGFAAAVNQGVERLQTEFILLLNPDVRLSTPVDRLLEECSRPEVAMAAGQLLHPGGQPQTGFSVRRLPGPAALIFEVLGLNRLFPSNRINQRYRCLNLDPARPSDVQQPAGAFLFFRRDLWTRLGGFDERFHPLWFEDVDFCKRTMDLGSTIRYVPEVQAVHQGAHSIAQLGWSSRELYWYVSLLKYASKHFSSRTFRGVSVAVVLGSVFRTLSGVAQKRSFEPCAVYAPVISFAAACAFHGQIPDPAVPAGSAESRRLRKLRQ